MPSGTIDLQELTRRLATRTDFAVSCKSCNRKKGNLTGREFVRVPTETRLMKFDEIDELTNRRRLRSRERKRLQREEKRRRLEQRRELRERKSRVRQGRDRIRSEPFPRPAPRMSDDVSIPMDVHGTALERYRQRYAKLHKRYGAALPKDKAEALRSLLESESARERKGALEKGSSSEE